MKYQCLLFVICSVLMNLDSIMSNATQPCETPQYVQLGTKGIVHCNFSDDFFGVYWYNSTDYVNEFSLINIKNSENPKTGPGFESGEFDVFHNGSLIIQKVNFGHAHTYTVVKLDSPTDVIIPHYVDVIVTALPTPPYPVIEGCDTQQACVMEVGNQGNLTCSVEGIVPNVTLEWREVQEDSSVVFIPNQQNTTRRTDGRYNVFLTSSFYINRKLGHSLNVECTVTVHKEGPKFDLRSPVVLVFADETTQQTAPTKGNEATLAAVVVIPVVAVVLVIVAVVLTYLFIKGRTNSSGLNTEMGLAKTGKGSKDSESEKEPLLDLKEVAPLQKILKEKYMDVFGSIIVVSTSQHKCPSQKIPNSTETGDEIQTQPTGNPEDIVVENCATVEKGTGDDSISIEQENSKSMEEEDKNDARTSWQNVEAGKPNISDTKASSAVKNVTATTFPDQTSFAEDRFVLEPMVQVLTSKAGSGTHGIWKNCSSISETLTDSNIESKNFIVEGEFGHKISSISKVLAREWSMEETSSLASKFDVLLLLKLNQISGDKTVFSEIKRLLLNCDTPLTNDHIEKVLQKHEKVVFILDGFNTYVDCECKINCELTKLIKREFLTNCTILLTTSPSCVPNESEKKFTRLRVKDLSANDQDFLISRNVSVKDTNSGDKIKSLLKENFLLRDILQIPLFFDMFLKMASQIINVPKFESITKFFLRIMSGFYMNSPKQNKHHDVALWDADLGKVAFEALKSKRGKDKSWSKSELCKSLGEEKYTFYHQMGVLKEEKVPQWAIKPFQTHNTIIAFDTLATFAHPLFCEWYAAHHLSATMKTDDGQYEEGELKILLSYNNWYCIRFLCNFNDEISREICKVVEPKVLQILCQLESQEKLQNITEAVKNWCSKEVSIEPEHSKAQQMATVQLLEFGSQKEVSHLTLKNCFNSVEGISEFLELRSGVQLPVLKNLKRLDVIEEGRELTNSEVTGIINFALRCSKLEDVKFFQCLLPKTLDGINIAGNSKFKGVKVEWTPDTESSHVYPLGHKKFTWKRQKGEDLDDTMYRGVVEVFRDKHGIKIQGKNNDSPGGS